MPNWLNATAPKEFFFFGGKKLAKKLSRVSESAQKRILKLEF